MSRPVAVVAGVGPGLGQALCLQLREADFEVVAHARTVREPEPGLRTIRCDLTDEAEVARAFEETARTVGAPSVLIYNAAEIFLSSFLELEPQRLRALLEANFIGAATCARQVLPAMVAARAGTITFTGATASWRGGARSAGFASSKFALRALAQALAREFAPQGVHVSHVVIDGLIWSQATRARFAPEEHTCLSPQAVATSYLALIRQRRSAWTHELDLRPDVERFS